MSLTCCHIIATNAAHAVALVKILLRHIGELCINRIDRAPRTYQRADCSLQRLKQRMKDSFRQEELQLYLP